MIRGVSPSPSHEDAARLNEEAEKKVGKKLDEETKQVRSPSNITKQHL